MNVDILNKKKKILKRIDFINLVESDKIWLKTMTKPQIKDLLEKLEKEISNYEFELNENFIMNSRRKFLKRMIDENAQENDGKDEIISESLFNFWEFVSDEYFGDFVLISKELGLSVQELKIRDEIYRKNGVICLQEKNIILEMIQQLKNF